jgi:hypothetical protein
MDYDASKEEGKHGSHYWCPTCWEMKKPSSTKAVSSPITAVTTTVPKSKRKKPSSTKAVSSPITAVTTTVPKSSYCSPCDSVELEFGLAEEYDSCFSSSLYLNDEDDKYLSSLPAEEKEKILADRFSILKEINDSNRELKLLRDNDIVEDPTVIAAKIVGTARCRVSGTK